MESNIVSGPPVPSDFLANIATPLHEHLVNCTESYRKSVCMIDAITSENITIDSVISQSIILASKLQSLGTKPGHVIGIICENRCEFPVIFLAVLRTGAIVACFNPAYAASELEHTLNITQPFIMFTNSDSFNKLKDINKKYKTIKYIILLDEHSASTSALNYMKLLTEDKNLKYIKPDTINSEDPALILFSSGSTGLPKGVMLSNRSIVFLLNMIRFNISVMRLPGEKDVILSVIPMFHGYGVLLVLTILITGDTMISLRKFDEELFLKAIEQYKVTSLTLVPPLMVFLAKHPLVKNFDLSSIKNVSCGAAPLSLIIEEKVRQYLNLDKVIKAYGMTETTVICTINSLSENKPGTVGKLAPGMIAKVIDLETGTPLGPNAEGEICLKGILVMKGYYNNKKDTEETFDKDGWLHTGDVGYYDADEDFFIVDRIKDLIKYKGFQVAPAELESLLLKHRAVKDAAVVGVHDEIAGELPKAFIVKQEDITEQELIDYVSSQVGPHMKLRGGVTFIKEIPRNSNGKILRKNLRSHCQSKL